MSIGWRVALEVPTQRGQVAVHHFLAHFADPKKAEIEVRKFGSAPDDSKACAYVPVTGEELADRKIYDGEIRSLLF